MHFRLTPILLTFLFGLHALLFNSKCNGGFLLNVAANAAPGANNDAKDLLNNNNVFDLWSESTSGGGPNGFSGSFFGDSKWALYANGTNSPSVNVTSTSFSSLFGRNVGNSGDSITMYFENKGVDSGGSVGLKFMNGTSERAVFQFNGGDSNYRLYDGALNDTGVGWTSSGLTVQLLLNNTAGSYTLKLNGTDRVTGRSLQNGASSTITHVEVYNFQGGGDLYFNNLQVSAVPEPTSLSLLGLTALAAMTGYRRRVR